MKKIALIASLLSVSAFAAGPHWDYSEVAKWGDLAEDYKTCKLGANQSPIDIKTTATEKASLSPIKTAYNAVTGEVVNNGHTIQVNLKDAGSAAVPSGSYNLLQFHFHTPSEEKINGANYPMVAHLVHKNEAGNLAVIAVLFKEGKENDTLKDVFANMPDKEGSKALPSTLDATKMLPANLGFYAFTGSLTTPPCSESVAWQVLKTPVELSKNQIASFKKIFAMNARPVQPLNGRKVQEAN
jgi:carbonic anhydrase